MLATIAHDKPANVANPKLPFIKRDVLLIITKEDVNFLPIWKSNYRHYFDRVEVMVATPITLNQVTMTYGSKIRHRQVITSNPILLGKLIAAYATKKDQPASLENFAGSTFSSGDMQGNKWDWLILPAFKNLVTRNYMKFMFGIWQSKFAAPDQYIKNPKHKWIVAKPSNFDQIRSIAATAILCAVDVETKQEFLQIEMCGFSYLLPDGTVFSTCVQYLDSYHHAFATDLLQMPVPKVMQNGHYDCSYFLRWNQPPTAYYYDTYQFQHACYSELPRNLGFVSAMWMHEVQYWKDERTGGTTEDRMFYNVQDCYNTLVSWMNMLHRRPDWASDNYVKSFKLVFPNINSGTFGLKVDLAERSRLFEQEKAKQIQIQTRLASILRIPTFNPNSSVQCSALLKILSNGTVVKTEKKEMAKFKEMGPIQELVGSLISDSRKAGKAASTYFNFDLLDERFLYKIDSAGTDTSRLASKSSDYWCGTQIQNMPGYAKSMVVVEDFEDPEDEECFAEIDNEQSESRTTAYLAQDLKLIDTVENSPDFHCTNCSLFFGIPFSDLFDVLTKKVLRKDIRTLGKRVNHGANYNMGAEVLVDTMGRKALYEAGRLLELSPIWSPKLIAAFLLQRFADTYPQVKGDFQKEIINEVRTTGKLVLPGGWTRVCFGKPWERKPDLNSYVAHKPQALSVQLVNEGYFRAWRDYQYIPAMQTGKPRIKMRAQIHDSLFFSYKKKDTEVIKLVSEAMVIPIMVHGRELRIPNAPKFGAKRWSELKD